MSRSLKKGIYIQSCILKKSISKTKKIYIWSRDSSIPSHYIDKQVFVHNGKTFKKINITREKVGFKFGEFVFTKTVAKSKKKISKKK